MKNEIHIENSFPTEELADIVREFVFLRIDSDKNQTIVAIDDGCYDWMFYREKEATLEFEHTKTTKISNQVFTVHQLAPPLKYRFGKSLSYFSIKVQPWLNNFFFPNQYQKGILNLENIFGNQVIEIHSEIYKTESFEQKVKIACDFLKTITPEFDEDIHLIKKVCEEIYNENGLITVNELSEKFERNRQLLNKTFKAHVNYTLKQFIIIVRIIALAKFRINNPDSSLTQVAFKFGYFDQAHFNYDFKRISGISPTEFFKELPPFFHRHKN